MEIAGEDALNGFNNFVGGEYNLLDDADVRRLSCDFASKQAKVTPVVGNMFTYIAVLILSERKA